MKIDFQKADAKTAQLISDVMPLNYEINQQQVGYRKIRM